MTDLNECVIAKRLLISREVLQISLLVILTAQTQIFTGRTSLAPTTEFILLFTARPHG